MKGRAKNIYIALTNSLSPGGGVGRKYVVLIPDCQLDANKKEFTNGHKLFKHFQSVLTVFNQVSFLWNITLVNVKVLELVATDWCSLNYALE